MQYSGADPGFVERGCTPRAPQARSLARGGGGPVSLIRGEKGGRGPPLDPRLVFQKTFCYLDSIQQTTV